MGVVERRREGAVALITLNRPDARNALSVELCDALVDSLASIESDRKARVTVVVGAGPVFCAGADVAELSASRGQVFLQAFERMLEAVAAHRLPVIAALHGAALGGGLQLATVCDLRIVGASTRVGIPSARLGIVVNLENVRRLVLLVGLGVATEILTTGRVYSGAEAASLGLAHRAVADDDVEAAALELAGNVARLAPRSVQGAKRALRAVASTLGDVRAVDSRAAAEVDELVAAAYLSDDLAEGLAAFAARRDPSFEDG